MIKQALKSKTVQFSIALAVLSVLQGFVVQLPVSPVAQAAIGCGIAVCTTVLRAVTTMPLSEK